MTLPNSFSLKRQVVVFPTEDKNFANLVVCEMEDCSVVRSQRSVDIVVGRFEAKRYYFSQSVHDRAELLKPVFDDYVK